MQSREQAWHYSRRNKESARKQVIEDEVWERAQIYCRPF